MNIIFPNNNEKEFLKVAEKLNLKELYLIYPFNKNINKYKEVVKSLNTNIKLNFGLIAEPKDIIKAKRVCNFVIIESSEKDQNILENSKPHLIFNLEKNSNKDKTHYRYSGLNQVMCKLANKDNIIIAFSFSELLNSTKERRSILLGRIIQNLRFCKKYKVETILSSFAKTPKEMRTIKDLNSLKKILQ